MQPKMFYAFMLVCLSLTLPTCWARFRDTKRLDKAKIEGKENMIDSATRPKAFDGNQGESKRGFVNFGAMTLCGTGRFPLHYNNYGCWCGIGGKGAPVDDVDRCCHDHDWCYYDVRTSKICPLSEFANYLSLYLTKLGTCTECLPASSYLLHGKCLNAICECDATAVKCFAKSPYNETYKGYPQDKCE